MTEISLIVTLNKQFNSTQQEYLLKIGEVITFSNGHIYYGSPCSYMKLMSFCCLTNIYWSNSKMTAIKYDNINIWLQENIAVLTLSMHIPWRMSVMCRWRCHSRSSWHRSAFGSLFQPKLVCRYLLWPMHEKLYISIHFWRYQIRYVLVIHLP